MARKPKPNFTGKSLTDSPPYIFQPNAIDEHRDLYFPLYCIGTGKVGRMEAEWRARAKREESEAVAQKRQTANLDLELQISKEEQIGPLRAIYYRELVLKDYYQTALQYSRFANTSFFCSEARKRDPNEWLAYDHYLDKMLASLGLNWWNVEQTIVNQFKHPLPKKFQKSFVNRDDLVSLWQIVWTDRMAANEISMGKRFQTKNLEELEVKVEPAGRLAAIASGEITSFAVGFEELILSNETAQIVGTNERRSTYSRSFTPSLSYYAAKEQPRARYTTW